MDVIKMCGCINDVHILSNSRYVYVENLLKLL
jgi:hypothetical protein